MRTCSADIHRQGEIGMLKLIGILAKRALTLKWRIADTSVMTVLLTMVMSMLSILALLFATPVVMAILGI